MWMKDMRTGNPKGTNLDPNNPNAINMSTFRGHSEALYSSLAGQVEQKERYCKMDNNKKRPSILYRLCQRMQGYFQTLLLKLLFRILDIFRH